MPPLRVTTLLVLALLPALPGPAPAGSLPGDPVPLGYRRTIASTVLGEERTVVVALPERYEGSTDRYPVLYVLDGEWHFPHAAALVRFLSEVRHNPKPPVPPMIVVGIENVDRNRDFTPTHLESDRGMGFPTSGESGRFLEFLESELIPLVETDYRTRPYRLLAGWSFGGLFAVNTLLESPGAFDGYIAVSPSLWWDGDLLVRKARERLASVGEHKTLIVTLGDEAGAIRPAVLHFVEVLEGQAPAGLDWTFHPLYGEDHNLVPPTGLYEGLRLAYRDWLMPDEVADGGLEAIRAYHDRLSEKYGYPVTIPPALFTRLARSHWYQDQFEEALTVCELRIRTYPDAPDAWFFLGAALENLERRDEAEASYVKAVDLEAGRPAPNPTDLEECRRALARVRE